VRSYGGQLTPLSQESILLAITNLLKEKRAQFIVLQSTNSLDQIFLSEFLRRADPGARVVVDGADLLFSRGAEGRSLRGVMLLSNYPLLTLQSDWTPSLVPSALPSVKTVRCCPCEPTCRNWMMVPQSCPCSAARGAGQPVERAGRPLTKRYWVTLLALFGITVTACRVALHEFCVTTLGERAFGVTIFFWICLCIAVILADAIQFWRVWSKLHSLLVYLDRLPLRRTLWALTGVSWKSIWRMSGNVLDERYRMISRQLESLTHLENAVKAWAAEKNLWPKMTSTCQRELRS